jgi:hypothetical protein
MCKHVQLIRTKESFKVHAKGNGQDGPNPMIIPNATMKSLDVTHTQARELHPNWPFFLNL